MKDGLRGLAVPLLAVLLWWLAAESGVGVGILPSPLAVVMSFKDLVASGELQAHVRISLVRIGQGFLLAAGLAVPAGILVAVFSPFAQYVSPILGFLRQVPPVAWIPVLIMVLGIGEATKLAVIVYAAFFPIFMNTILGITQIDDHFWEVARLLELSPREVLRELEPIAAPSLIAGLRLGCPQLAALRRDAGAFSGLGYMITAARSLVRMDEMFIGIAAIGLFGLVIDWGWKLLERRVLRWQNRD